MYRSFTIWLLKKVFNTVRSIAKNDWTFIIDPATYRNISSVKVVKIKYQNLQFKIFVEQLLCNLFRRYGLLLKCGQLTCCSTSIFEYLFHAVGCAVGCTLLKSNINRNKIIFWLFLPQLKNKLLFKNLIWEFKKLNFFSNFQFIILSDQIFKKQFHH